MLGATIPLRLLEVAGFVESERLHAGLQDLCAAGRLRLNRTADGVDYAFKHALIRDAACRHWQLVELRAAHERIATLLVEAFDEQVQVQAAPHQVAFHYARADRFPRPQYFGNKSVAWRPICYRIRMRETISNRV